MNDYMIDAIATEEIQAYERPSKYAPIVEDAINRAREKNRETVSVTANLGEIYLAKKAILKVCTNTTPVNVSRNPFFANLTFPLSEVVES